MGFSEYLLPFILFLFPFSTGAITGNTCDGNNLKKFYPKTSLDRVNDPELVFYGLTQDCQLFFLRPDQLDQLTRLHVQSRVTYCLPNLVQLHWRQHHQHGADGTTLGLQLLFKRANNQICTLPVEFPSKNALSGLSIFSYSILSSLNYASCSYMANSSFIMEPDLSFMDTSYSDVVYFVDPGSQSTFWNVRQFKFDKHGYFKSLDSFIIKNIAEEVGRTSLCARDYLIVLDGQRHKLHSMQRHNKLVSSTCAYDLLFRPSKTKIKKLEPLRHDSAQFRVNSFAADGNHLLIGESHRVTHDQFLTKLFISDQDRNDTSECLVQLNYLAEFGFISMETKETLEKINLPHFGHRKLHNGVRNLRNDTQKSAAKTVAKIPIEPLVTRQSMRSEMRTTTPRSPLKTTTTTAKPGNDDKDNDNDASSSNNNNVGDGKILDSEEVEEREKERDEAEETDEELGFMTEITTRNILTSQTEQQLEDLEGSGLILSANDTNSENLNSTASYRYSLYPVFIVFSLTVTFNRLF